VKTVDIARPLREITDLLGLDYEFVSRIEFTPHLLRVTEYKKDALGRKYVDADTERAAVNELTFAVKT